ncbi:MAG: hypothetical protein AAGE79_14895, partial [Acinetobacter pittii]
MNYYKEQNKDFRKKLVIVIIAVALTAMLFPWIKKTLGFPNDEQQRIEYLRNILDSSKRVDSVQLSHGKVSRHDLEIDYSVDSWFTKHRSNKVAFDNAFNHKTLDVYGEVKEISKVWGCSQVILKQEDGTQFTISCSNCVDSKDKWINEVEKIFVGGYVYIKGKYSA